MPLEDARVRSAIAITLPMRIRRVSVIPIALFVGLRRQQLGLKRSSLPHRRLAIVPQRNRRNRGRGRGWGGGRGRGRG